MYIDANRVPKKMSRITEKIMTISLTPCVATVVGYFIHVFADDEAEEDMHSDFVERASDYLASLKAQGGCDLGPNRWAL